MSKLKRGKQIWEGSSNDPRVFSKIPGFGEMFPVFLVKYQGFGVKSQGLE